MIKKSIQKHNFEELKVFKIIVDDEIVNSKAYFWEP